MATTRQEGEQAGSPKGPKTIYSLKKEERGVGRERMAHRGGVEDWVICSFGTEAPWEAGAEGLGGGFLLSRLRQRAEGQTGYGGSWAAAGGGPGSGEDRDGEAGPAAALEP